MRLTIAVSVTLLVVAALPSWAAADDARCGTQVRLMEPARPCDVALVPFNLAAGYVAVMDATTVASGAVLGAEVLTMSWGPLFVSPAQMRLALYGVEGGGIGADFFVGSGAGWALRLDEGGEHQLVVGGAAGWGAIGTGWGGRVAGDGGLVASAFVRYAFLGLLGVEVQALLPVTGDLGAHYPAALAISVIGLPLLALGALGG